MPGMMETVLNIGLNDASVKGLAEASGDERFAWDSYRRLLQMYGKTVLDINGERFADALDGAKAAKGVASDVDLDVTDLRDLVETFKTIVREESGEEFPQHPREQLDHAIRSVFDSWNTERARLYRRRERIPEHRREQPMLVLGSLRPRGDEIRDPEEPWRLSALDHDAIVVADLLEHHLASCVIFADVVQEDVDRRVAELARPFLGRSVELEIDPRSVHHVTLEQIAQ
jgi:hypothetical protein